MTFRPTRQPWEGCRVTHPLTRIRCSLPAYAHDLHSSEHPGQWWNSATGKTTSPVGLVYVEHYGRFTPVPGEDTTGPMEHFPNAVTLRHEVAGRITYSYGTEHPPGASPRTVHYDRVAPHAYMDVWVRVRPCGPPLCTDRPVERWYRDTRGNSVRTPYLTLRNP